MKALAGQHFLPISIMGPTVPIQLLDVSGHRCQHSHSGRYYLCPHTGPAAGSVQPL